MTSAADGIQKLKLEPQPKQPPAEGLLPPAFSRDIHLQRALLQLRSKASDIEKYIYLSQLKDTDEDIFYKLCLANMNEITPLIYTPTVGDACLQYSRNFRRPEGLFISIRDKGRIGTILRNWPAIDEARISVVTDGKSFPPRSRILGLGDLGLNGMPIAIGKLSLYVAGAGIRPSSTLPITLDLGTNNQTFLNDPLYLGLRQERAPEGEYDEFMEEFMTEMSRVYPKLLVQFEDFSTNHAFSFLSRFRHRFPLFNDDIQGTGAVVLAGLVSAARLSPLQPHEHRILFYGAGSAGIGVANQLLSFFTLNGMTKEEARSHIWIVDSKGLIYDDRDHVAEYKKVFSRNDYSGPPMTDLLDIVEYVRPTALMGLSTVKGAFTEAVIRRMASQTPRPIIFPLSNPSQLSECTFSEALRASGGSVLFASGSPFPEENFAGRTWEPGQGNNMYIFPGLGLGSILCRASSVTDSMVEATAIGLANSLSSDERALELVYPRLQRIREISAHIAVRVIRAAQAADVDRSSELRKLSDEELLGFVQEKMWTPQ
ncbi:hypothetical protein JVT61DRAFT_15276 [Boletus reticuloceps]|uniref:Malic enzyme n=1 Tax=Boletus reticuloceps TaxID=495285 RepID=A0A8I2YS77_9AGAM|nr:hypothetical protein JVT61DRAFT_15276 [Boletus reticuloceps]